mgnify:CR=1 FL=1
MERQEMLKWKKAAWQKLMGAIAMLLVASIMMSATSYAWFVLSTAPEVTDLTTTAGANGALEIALQSNKADGTGRADILSGVGQSIASKDAQTANTYWGNVVDLSKGYGLEHITLYPARLNAESKMVGGQSSYVVLTNSILAAPSFGTDGRLVRLEPASKTHYNASGDSAGKFTDTANWGVNVIGFAKSGDEATEDSFTRAYSRANVLAETTQKVETYRVSLRTEMEELIKRNSMGIFGVMAFMVGQNLLTSEQMSALVTDYVSSMDRMIGDAADAVRWAFLANAVADSAYNSNSEDDMRELGEIYKNFLQYPLTTKDSNVKSVENMAGTKYPEIAEAARTISVAQARISSAAQEVRDGGIAMATLMLVNPNEAFMYGMNANEKIADQPLQTALTYDFMSGVTEDTVFMVSTAGADPMDVNLFSSLATVLGDYGATMSVWLLPTSQGFTMAEEKLDESPNWMQCNYDIKATTKSTAAGWSDVTDLELAEQDANIGALGTVYKNVSSQTATGEILMPVTRSDITAYGYSVDLAFQSSEATSLILQQDGVARVSSGSQETQDEELMGAGSTMVFTLPGDLTHEQARELIKCIHVVFMNTANGTIYKVAAADPVTIDTRLNVATATLQLYEPQFSADGAMSLGSRVSDNVILDMTKDTAYYVTAVVYLNGDMVQSGMFSPSQVLSLDGTINLQFASSTALQPMEYSGYVSQTSAG